MHPAENEVEWVNFAVRLGEDGIFRTDVGGDDFSALPGEGGKHVMAGRRKVRAPIVPMHPVGELGRSGIFPNEEGLFEKEKTRVRAEAVEIETGGKVFFGKCEAAQGLGKSARAQNPEAFGVCIDGPTETCLSGTSEKFDDLLIRWITKNNRFAATANECPIAFGVSLMEIREAHRKRAAEFRGFAEN